MLNQWYTGPVLPPHLNISDILTVHCSFTDSWLALYCLTTALPPVCPYTPASIHCTNTPYILLSHWAIHCICTEGALPEITDSVLDNHCFITSVWSGYPLQTGHIMRILSSLNSHRMRITFPVCKEY